MDIEKKAHDILNKLYGDGSKFRDGQYDAIYQTLTNKRTLVVQKTGWGKSLVYFVCTKILRDQKKGVTIVISPLLVLMQNQLDAAEKLNLKCGLLNSTTIDSRDKILNDIKENRLDLVLITPETLFSNDVLDTIKQTNIGLFVIDEAHCISDWGHDFRLQYSRLNQIIRLLPENIPLLGTTATANDRVIDDLKHQFGQNPHISRGSLRRDSLNIEVIKLRNRADRYTWILKALQKLENTGIIYCLTQRDCEYVSDFLNKNNISARPYYSKANSENEMNENINLFQQNKIKVLVATIKLGMGYDKGDISFVIHFQLPSNIVSYYQQIGRAGRAIENAYIFLMSGPEDQKIIDHFINTAFPQFDEVNEILTYLKQNTDGVSVNKLLSVLNIKLNRLSKALSFLENDNAIYKEKSKYYISAKKYIYKQEYYDKITQLRIKERNQMIELLNTKQCYQKFIINALDDNSDVDCMKCSNCLKKSILDIEITDSDREIAQIYLNSIHLEIIPRKKWALTSKTTQTAIKHLLTEGICLSKIEDPGYGSIVRYDIENKNDIRDEIVYKSASLLKEYIKKYNITHITNIPSNSSNTAYIFAKKLSKKLNIKYIDTLYKIGNTKQINMQNSSYQCMNAINSYKLIENIEIPENILLVDILIDSKWTLTVCSNLLGEAGARNIFGYVLADISNRGDDNEK